jgi:hydroxymethylbilane synthase
MSAPLRIGTRASPLALTQTHMVRAALIAAHPFLAEEGAIEILPIKTSGDMSQGQNRSLADLGGDKGLFTKELEEALMSGKIDIAIHSMKDVPTWLPKGLGIIGLLPREDPREAFFSRGNIPFKDLPQGAKIGTSSLRRQAQLLAIRPDLEIVPLRGNVDTRIRKMENGDADATLLALAGLRRLGIEHRATEILSTDILLPSAAQGAIGIEARVEDSHAADLIRPICCAETTACIAAERAFLDILDGSCRTPIAALAEADAKGVLRFRALVASTDGRSVERLEETGTVADAENLGRETGRVLKARLPLDFFACGC